MSLPLPDLILFSDYGNNWEIYLEALYEFYMNEIVNAGLTYNGIPIHYRFIPYSDGKGYGFWHIISEGEDEADRLPDFHRCEKLLWIKWMILESSSNPDIRQFESPRGSSINVVLWNYVLHYTVILGKRADYCMLITAFSTSQGRERSFEKDWNKSQFKG